MSAPTSETAAEPLIDMALARFALAGELGRLRGAVKLALGALDFALAHPSLAVAEAAEAARVLRMALEAEGESDG